MVGLVLFIVFITGSFHEIQIQALLQPKLVVSRPVITEKDTVTLDCQCPPDAIQCYFYTEGGETKISSCQKTLSGSELLLLAGQSSPAEVKVRCFYAVRSGDRHPPSPHSEISSITIHRPPTSTPVTSIKGLTVSTSRNTREHAIFSSPTPGKPDMRMWTLRALAVTAAFAVTVGFISLGLTFLCTTRKIGTEKPKRQEPQNEQSVIYHQYDTISEEPPASVPNNMVYSTLQPI
ncbi:uncharacterized protein LOC117761842 isoform X9 [Hippoglossus hippoglossus]|uniref:uncharacterized protein LOC117761842 isoform X9 n=1 Tax=Hippoglossus hippoglossus TaxID=8267 RepID=UPI00148D9EF4|nr:uncharacterized protein LOC117761842 isoform X9 [Hippoglossus hippoglossus]